MVNECFLWLIGWLVYPFILLAGAAPGASKEYREVQDAIREWLHHKPNRKRRREVHRLSAPTRRPSKGW